MLLGLGVAVWWLVAPAEAGEPRPAVLGSGRLVVVPVNLAVRATPEIEPGIEPTWRALLAYFASDVQPVLALDRPGAGALWNEVMTEAQRKGAKDLYAGYARFAQRVAEQAQFEAILFPTLVTHSARVKGRVASWDGVNRAVGIPGPFTQSIETFRAGKIWLDREGASGELAAASLHIAVFDADGTLRHEGRGGLVLLQEIVTAPRSNGSELATALRKEPFAAPDQLREGIGAAFK